MIAPTTSPTLPDYGVELTKMLGVIGLFFVILLLIAWVLLRVARGKVATRTAKLLHQVDAITLEPGKRVYLLRVGTDHYLIGSGPDGLRMLAPHSVSIDDKRFDASLERAGAGTPGRDVSP